MYSSDLAVDVDDAEAADAAAAIADFLGEFRAFAGASWRISYEARQRYCLTRQMLGVGVVLGVSWVGFLVVVAVLALALDFGVISGRPLVQEIWSAELAVTGMMVS